LLLQHSACYALPKINDSSISNHNDLLELMRGAKSGIGGIQAVVGLIWRGIRLHFTYVNIPIGL